MRILSFKKSIGERVYEAIITFILIIAMTITLYPFIYVFSMSISDPAEVAAQTVWLLPKGFSLDSYKIAFENPDLWRSYYNTLWYTVVGTTLNVFLTIIGAYPLSRKNFQLRHFFMVVIAITMFFSGGLIPMFILVNKLGLYNTRWAVILPGAVSAWNLIIARVFFQSTIPDSLPEAAKLDGCSDIGILFRVVMPLSMPIIAVLTLYYAVGHWNSYFSALLYLPDQKLQPVQIYLMKVLIEQTEEALGGLEDLGIRSSLAAQMKYTIIIIVVLPILCVYPFLQKYFVKGVMIGAIKE